MIEFTTPLYAAMNEALEQAATTAENNLQCAERSYAIVQDTLQQVKEFILDYEFTDVNEEVLFFKEIKPGFLRQLIYYLKVFYIEAGKPVGGKEIQASYYTQVSGRVNAFFERNYLFYIYYRMGKSDHDLQYFTRSSGRHELLPEYLLDIDPKFSTIHSYKLAKLQAYERLNEYILAQISSLNDANASVSPSMRNRPQIKWTDPKVALIELGYSIFCRGAVNKGKADIKDIMHALEYAFNIDLGNYYVVFQQNIRIRKKNRTSYLDQLKEYLERHMDDLDINPR